MGVLRSLVVLVTGFIAGAVWSPQVSHGKLGEQTRQTPQGPLPSTMLFSGISL